MKALTMLFCIALTLPSLARADGVTYSMNGATTEPIATEQRAIMWLRDGTWEIHIQPVFARDALGAAWVVPFPVLPQVFEGSADQLDILTTQIFAEVCDDDRDVLQVPFPRGRGHGCDLERRGP